MKTLRLILLLLVSLPYIGSSQVDSVIERIISIGTSDNRTMEYLDILSNRIGGRLVGSNAYDNAAEWAAGK